MEHWEGIRGPLFFCRLPLLIPFCGSIRRPAASFVLFLLSSSSLFLALAAGSVVCADSRRPVLLAGLNCTLPPLPLLAAWLSYPPSPPPLFPYPHGRSCRQPDGGQLSSCPPRSRRPLPPPAGYQSEPLPPVVAATVGLRRPRPAGVALHPLRASVSSPPRVDSVAGLYVSGSCSSVSCLASFLPSFRATMCGRKGRAAPRRCSSPSWTCG